MKKSGSSVGLFLYHILLYSVAFCCYFFGVVT